MPTKPWVSSLESPSGKHTRHQLWPPIFTLGLRTMWPTPRLLKGKLNDSMPEAVCGTHWDSILIVSAGGRSGAAACIMLPMVRETAVIDLNESCIIYSNYYIY
jgi:hypothetical protein